MKVLVADAFPAERLKELEQLGLTLECRPDLPAAELPAALAGVSILVVRGRKVGREVFEKADALALVVRAGAGVNTIDVGAASRRGVYVANCPGQNAAAVAELAMGLICSLDRRITAADRALKEGRWEKKTFAEARGLLGRTLGIAGFGTIGREVAWRARAFGMRVCAWSRSLDESTAASLGVDRVEGLEALAARSEVLSIHLPLNDGTRGVISRKVLEALRPGCILVNTARAEVVDQEALLEQARSGRLRIACDVWQGEPEGGGGAFASELGRLPSVVGTPHIGASTDQAQDAIAAETVRIVSSFVREGAVPHCVNLSRSTPAHCQLIVRHHDRVGVLANVLNAIREEGINVQEMDNRVFEGAAAACARIRLDRHPPDEVFARIRSRVEEVISVQCVDLD